MCPTALHPTTNEWLIAIAAAQATVALENARLYRDLQERAQNLERAYAELEQADGSRMSWCKTSATSCARR